MTRKLTREERIQCLYDLKIGQVLNQSDIENIKMLARMALAALGSEPVVRPAPECQHQWRQGGANKLQNQKQCIKCGRVELDAQPAPVVPDAYVRDERGRMMLNGVCEPKIGFGAGWNACRAVMLQAGNSPVIPDGYVMVPKEITDEIGEAIAMQANCCGGIALDIYDAMLAAAPHDTPTLNSLQSVDSVADTWIPVSERMPENKPGCYKYLVFETLNNRVNHDYWNVPDKGDEAFTPFWNYYGEHVTHWMPLPAAPQEVNHG
ncbi:DUF551 domain-containing protein [Klebsiella oxytoca]|uniref:DUF551 domain-containing protein n=1 Tax=Klebsiella oxytoca TaxID=571 RepID=UPI00265EF6BD|nr:DUF551 domain-containing protein [Klebsiella oxytoca]WKM72915.1 DUF551 domain-containing protein [Klebsiella oxytoca]